MSEKKQAFDNMKETFGLYHKLFDRVMKLVDDKVVYTGWLLAYGRNEYYTKMYLDTGYYRSDEYRKKKTRDLKTSARLYREDYESALARIEEAEEKAKQGLGWLPGEIWIPLEEKKAKLEAGLVWNRETESWEKKTNN